ncbi:MAG: regulatory protein GemA [Clostridiales bacterium]|nr:regulatory protein GemA [Clostridiales bacterium]
MPRTTEYITKAQIGCLYATARSLGIDNEDVHAAIHAMTGRSSVKQLTARQAAYVIDRLKSQVQPKQTDISRHLTTETAWKIRQLQEQLGWTDERLEGFLGKRFGVARMAWLDMPIARKVIEGMKAIAARETDKEVNRERTAGLDS